MRSAEVDDEGIRGAFGSAGDRGECSLPMHHRLWLSTTQSRQYRWQTQDLRFHDASPFWAKAPTWSRTHPLCAPFSVAQSPSLEVQVDCSSRAMHGLLMSLSCILRLNAKRSVVIDDNSRIAAVL